MCRASGVLSVRLSVRLSVLLIFGVSAFIPHASFRYQLLASRRSEACQMCFGDECWALESARCRYYAAADEALGEIEAGGGGTEVDELVQDMVGQAASSWLSQECIPLVSYHTDCNKENICVGCRECACDANGGWRCRAEQRCRAEPTLEPDHRVLLSVADTLRNDISIRKKRSAVHNNTKKSLINAPHKMSYAEIVEWMYGVKSSVPDNTARRDFGINNNKVPESTTVNVESNPNYIEFDEVLHNIAIDNQKRKKLHLEEKNYDYMDMDDVVIVKNNNTDQFVNMLNAIVNGDESFVTDPTVEESTKFVINLLASLNTSDTLNSTDTDITNSIYRDEFGADISNDSIKFDAFNIMKRDVSSVLKTNSTTETPVETSNVTATKSVIGLVNDVLVPLNKIIDDKQQELKDLVKIKENLMQFIKNDNDSHSNMNTKNQELLNGTNTVLSIYNLDIFPEIQFDLRKINPNVLEKWLYKLKRDIYEVIRDVVGIKKISKTSNLPDDLKNLIRAMSLYVHKQKNVTNIKANSTKLKGNSVGRRFENETENPNSTKDYLVKILELIDKKMSQSEYLSSLSKNTRKIVKRVLKNHYSDDFSTIGLRVYDPEYNLTNDLRSIGGNWKTLTANIAASEMAEKLYAIKLLHFTISSDINKLNNALTLIDYAHSRRMIPIEEEIGDRLLDKINRGLESINDKIQTIMKYKIDNNFATVKPITDKKKSFLSKIRNLLKGSKKDIVDLVNKKVPKSEIVKTIAKKKLDELAQRRFIEYEETMKKWQNALNVVPRYKRSLDLKNHNRMKNIIPKYLRGKLTPAIAAKRSKRNQVQKKGVSNNPRNKERHSKVATTIKTIATSIKLSDHATTAIRKIDNNKKTKRVTTKIRSNTVLHHHQFTKSKGH